MTRSDALDSDYWTGERIAHYNHNVIEGGRSASAAEQAIIDISARWVYARNQWCDWALPMGNVALQTACDAVVPPVEGMPYVRGDAYLARVAQFSAKFDVPINDEDAEQVKDYLARLASGDNHDGLIITVAFDTANGGGVENRDEDVSKGDLEAMTDPELARIQVREAAEALGVELSDEELDRLTALAVSSAWIALAGWKYDDDNDNFEVGAQDTLENRLDEQHALEHPEDNDDIGPPPRPDQIDYESIPDLSAIDGNFDGVGICAEISGSGGPAAGEVGTCFISTDQNLGQIVYAGFGPGGGASAAPGGSIGAGGIVTNAQELDALRGYAISVGAGGGDGVGGSGSVCFNLTKDPIDGMWRFNGIVTVQGNVTLTTPTLGGSGTLVRTDVVWQNGTLNLIRVPIETGVNNLVESFSWWEIPGRIRLGL